MEEFKMLIKSEIQKYKLFKYIKIEFIVIFCILLFITISLVDSMSDPEQTKDTFESILRMIDLLVTGSFIIFAAVLIAKYIIGEYKNRTILILFTYPISRTKIILSKLFLVAVFTLAGIVTGYCICVVYIFAAELFFNVLEDSIESFRMFEIFNDLLQQCVIGTIMSMLPFIVGMIKKSGSMAIVSSVLTVVLMQPIIGRNLDLPELLVKLSLMFLIIGGLTWYTLKTKIHLIGQ